ncbi:ASCH domain-containing protein [Streptococcus thermophilus]
METTKIVVLPLKQVSVDHTKKVKEIEALAYWQKIHEDLFSKWLHEAGLNFS